MNGMKLAGRDFAMLVLLLLFLGIIIGERYFL